MSLNKIVVPTMKHIGDDRVPDALEVETPFSIGQELDFEYDIHNKMQRAQGYGGWTTFSGSKDIGHFKISGIFANMLISPPKTMVEVESLDERFNRIYPTQKTMVIEQESLLKRIRMQKPALDDTIQSASIRTGDSHASPDTPVKTPIQFVEKEPWPNIAPFIGGCDMYPTYMVKDGVEYFMFNRRSDESAYESDRDKSCKAQLLANGGKFFRFYGYVETPYEYLRNVIERHHSFENFSHKEVEWFDDGSFCDFHGNLKEVEAAFKFRIYDKRLAANIEKIVGLIHQKKYDKALDVLNKCPNNENVKRTASLVSKIESASARATESQPISHMRAKEIEPQL